MPKRYLVIKPDNTAEYKDMPIYSHQLKVFQGDVEGYVEVVRVPGDPGNHFFLVNEEGLITNPPKKPNPIASHFLSNFGYTGILHGNAVLLKQDGESWTYPSPALCNLLANIWKWNID